MGMIQAFGDGHNNCCPRQVCNILIRDQFPVRFVAQVGAVYPVVPCGNDGGKDDVHMAHAKKSGIFNDVAAVPCVVVVIDGNPCIVKQGRCFHKVPPAFFRQLVKALPAIKDSQGKAGHKTGMFLIWHILMNHVVAARFKDVRRNEGHVFVLVPIFAKEAFPEPTAGDDEFFRIAFVCQGLDDGAASDDDVCPVA